VEKRLNRLLGALTAALVLTVAAAAGAPAGVASRTVAGEAANLLAPPVVCPGSGRVDLPPTDQTQSMLCLVEYVRAQAGLSPLRETKTLDRAAMLKIDADVRCGEFSHTPCGDDFVHAFQLAGYPLSGSYSVGENLAYGQGNLGSPRRIMAAWLASPDHRANLLTPTWKTVGIGVRPSATFLGDRRVSLWANEFATP